MCVPCHTGDDGASPTTTAAVTTLLCQLVIVGGLQESSSEQTSFGERTAQRGELAAQTVIAAICKRLGVCVCLPSIENVHALIAFIWCDAQFVCARVDAK